jgi:hypothetical protein
MVKSRSGSSDVMSSTYVPMIGCFVAGFVTNRLLNHQNVVTGEFVWDSKWTSRELVEGNDDQQELDIKNAANRAAAPPEDGGIPLWIVIVILVLVVLVVLVVSGLVYFRATRKGNGGE